MEIPDKEEMIANIPDELKDRCQWVCWDSKKLPINARNGRRAEVDNPSTWSTFEAAKDAVLNGKYRGVGFVLTKDDPYTIIDLDHVINPDTGEVLSWASRIIARIGSYTEISQSGTGIHIILKGKKSTSRCKFKYESGQVEIYDCSHYFALTGDIWRVGA